MARPIAEVLPQVWACNPAKGQHNLPVALVVEAQSFLYPNLITIRIVGAALMPAILIVTGSKLGKWADQ